MDVIELSCAASSDVTEVQRLTQIVEQALFLADQLGLNVVALHLNDALVELTGAGHRPPGWSLD